MSAAEPTVTTCCEWPAHRDEPKCEKSGLLWAIESALADLERGREYDAIATLERALESGSSGRDD